MRYDKWLVKVCEHVEELMDCTTNIDEYGNIVLMFKPFGKMVWFMMFEKSWLSDTYNLDSTSPRATAYNMTIMTEREWRQIIRRKGESND